MNIWSAIVAILLGLVPPAVWRFTRGARLQQQASTDGASIDRDDLVWQSWVSASALTSILFALVAFGVLPVFGGGFLRAEEADKRRSAMVASFDSKVARVEEAQKEQGRKLDKVTYLLTEQLATAKAAQIRLVISKRCKTTGYIERDEQLREIDRLQDEYMDLKGVKYAAPTCGEL